MASRAFALLLAAAFLMFSGCSKPSPYQSTYSPIAPAPQVSKPTQSPYPSSSGVKIVQQPLNGATATGTVSHEVGPLETLWRISKMYDVPVDAICQANGLSRNDPLRIGQTLTIPGAKCFRNIIPLYPNSRWTYIIVHHTATEIGKASIINRAHNERGFWQGLGYHFLIDNGTLGKGDGQIEASPRWIKQLIGAHCKANGMNSRAIGVALVGNFNYETPTANQLDSLAYLLRTLMEYYHIPSSNIMGHRDVDGASTECPGKLFPWPQLRQCLVR